MLRCVLGYVLCLVHIVGTLAALSDYYVSSIPGTESIDLPEMYSGSLNIPTKSGTEPMFFWLYESKYRTTKPKTMIWLNGGPGCSSLDGALLELGPLRFQGDGGFQYNEGNWGEYLNILYLDQPFGTGYSFLNDPSDAVGNVEDAASLVNQFLEHWLELFPHHAHDEFYFGGESFAGQYIPYIQRNLTAVKLEGIILANPWIDTAHQYLSYASFVKEKGLLDPSLYDKLDILHMDCVNSLQTYEKIPTGVPVCDKLTAFITENSRGDGRCFNVYNYELEDSFPACGMNWPNGVDKLPAYLNRADVLEALHVNQSLDTSKWVECSSSVHNTFKNVNKATASTLLPDILRELPVMIMVGDLDFVCNYKGLSSMVSSMSWGEEDSPTRGWLPDEKLHNFTVGGKTAGDLVSGRNLTFARVFNGSHMIPVDKQFETRALIHWFTGVTREISDAAPLDATQPSQPRPEHDAAEDKTDGENESDEATNARKSAYKRAGITALVVIIILTIALALWLFSKGEVHLSWAQISSGFARALLHVGNPKIRKTFDYISLDTFRPSGVPSTIIEEEEEEDGFTV